MYWLNTEEIYMNDCNSEMDQSHSYGENCYPIVDNNNYVKPILEVEQALIGK